MNMNLEKIVARTAEAVGVYGHLRTSPQRVEPMAAATLLAQAAGQELELFTRWCYVKHERHWLHILPSGQIPSGVFTPWGSSGKSNLTRSSRDTLRKWLLGLADHRYFPPFIYAAGQRRWYVDLMRYPELDDALAWLAKYPINPSDWLTLSLAARQ